MTSTLLSAHSSSGTWLHRALEAGWRLEAVKREDEGLSPLVDLLLSRPQFSQRFLDLVEGFLMSQLLSFVANNVTKATVKLWDLALLRQAGTFKYELCNSLVVFLGERVKITLNFSQGFQMGSWGTGVVDIADIVDQGLQKVRLEERWGGGCHQSGPWPRCACLAGGVEAPTGVRLVLNLRVELSTQR